MRRVKLLLLAAFGVAALFLAGCLFVPARPTGEVEGFVVDSGAGSPVVGASVTAYPLDGMPEYWARSPYFSPTATTDANGHYRLVLPKGTYVITVTKDGFATTRIEGVKVASTVKLNIIEKPVFNPNWSLEPPKVTLTGVTEGATYSGPISYRVDAEGANDIRLIYVALGKTPGSGWLTAPRQIFESTYTTGDTTIDPADFGVSGWTTFEVVVYDQNENRTHLIRHIYIEPAAGVPTIRPPQNPGILAVTLSKKVYFYGQPLSIPSGKGELEIHAAPPGSNLYIELTWDASPDDASITGYRIYRKLAGETDWTLVGTVGAAGDPTASYQWRDGSPELKVGVEASYQIRAYVGNTESAAITASATPLPTWDVRLLEPADEATGVSLTPTFRWQPTQLVGNDQVYRLWLNDATQGWWFLISDFLLNQTEVAYSDLYIYAPWTAAGKTPVAGTPWERLQPFRNYEWYLDFAAAYDDFANPTAVSVAINDWVTGDFVGLPATDFFSFTTGEE